MARWIPYPARWWPSCPALPGPIRPASVPPYGAGARCEKFSKRV